VNKPRRQHAYVFKMEAVRLPETSDKSVRQLERELGIGAGNLSRYKQEFAVDGEDDSPSHDHHTQCSKSFDD
jgi:transposase-like protein